MKESTALQTAIAAKPWEIYFPNVIQMQLFYFQTIEGAKSVSKVIADRCPEPNRVEIGLNEVFFNAVEHGNLGINLHMTTFPEEQLVRQNQICEKMQKKENIAKFVEVLLEKTPDYIKINVKDQGDGFCWKKYTELDPKTNLSQGGRGIYLAKNYSFDDLDYTNKGNEVICMLYL